MPILFLAKNIQGFTIYEAVNDEEEEPRQLWNLQKCEERILMNVSN